MAIGAWRADWTFFTPQAGLLALEEEQAAAQTASAPLYRAVPREVIIEYSRQHYARPRAEVEAIVLSQLRPPNQPPNERQKPPPSIMDNLTAEQKETVRQLQDLGVNTEQAASLLARFDVARIRRQIAWLPARRVKNPTGFLIAAIERDYEAPRLWQLGHQLGLLSAAEKQPAPEEPDGPTNDTNPAEAGDSSTKPPPDGT